MAQEIEIEYKNLLKETEFHSLLAHLPFPQQGKTQINYYFETENFSLKKSGCALRIREKNNAYQLTLKEPHQHGLLETHDNLTKEEASQWIQGSKIEKEHTGRQLKDFGINVEDLIYFGSLTTVRRELNYKDVLLVLDYSTYNGQADFELELEAPSVETGLSEFDYLLKTYAIPKRKTPNKIKRFFNTL
ncbi:CYTH domain-containing protein [Virgibacillus sp. C22-A2]|uniref:CYTH domain-containing protein n=1 Tax=Virgibacillus tibetensis TaxID=3042313 RepID=A0ABU6KE31_9BACI|nr:CYTH domain-containing protein [Virgibacillus sp. C22-A2]